MRPRTCCAWNNPNFEAGELVATAVEAVRERVQLARLYGIRELRGGAELAGALLDDQRAGATEIYDPSNGLWVRVPPGATN